MGQVGRLGPKVGGHVALCCIHRVNRVNSRSALSTMTAPQTLSWLLLLLLLFKFHKHVSFDSRDMSPKNLSKMGVAMVM